MSQSFEILDLRCEYLIDPRGIDELVPRLSYMLESDRRGARQVARRIRVASSLGALGDGDGDLWDTGKVESDATTQIVYEGAPLPSRQQCWWRVEVWDERGELHLSAVASWSMGLLEEGDWKAQWIAADPHAVERDPEAIEPTLLDCGTPCLFRTEFSVKAGLRSATLYVSARGVVEARLSGVRISEDLFAPEWTDYHKRIQYRTYDVGSMLDYGPQALGILLGDGWWSGYVGWQETRARYGSLENSFVAQLELVYEDGHRETIASGPGWTCNTGPILYSDFMMGEAYDARRERQGWDRTAYDDSDWLPAVATTKPAARLVAQRAEPARIGETFHARSVNQIASGAYILDLGQNISGWARLRVNEPAGTRIVLRFAERLNPDGTLYTDNLRRARSTDTYICRGEGVESWQPHFTFHGFQYIEVSGLSSAPSSETVVGCAIYSAMAPSGDFDCSHAGINRLWLNGLWSQKDNFLSVPTDCPQRDERLGWMGDAQVFLRTASYNMDVAAFFTKWMVDVLDAQTEDGLFPDTAPRLSEGDNYVGLDDLVGGAGWADAGVIIPYTLWRVYGDTRIVERCWAGMTAWLDYLERTNPECLRVNDLRNNYGDWLCLPSDREFRTQSPMKDLLATAFWADDAAKLAAMSRAIGRAAEAERFEAVFRKVRAAFQEAFVRPDGSLTVDTQTAYLLALSMNLMPEPLRDAAMRRLVANIEGLDWRLSTGFIGIRLLNPTLTEEGRNDVAYRLLLQEGYPSWLYPINHGATTIWERWNGWTKEDGFFDPLMNSFNHYSLGSVGEWLFRHVGGIELDPQVCGFKRFSLNPYPGDGLSYAKATYRSAHGAILSHWSIDKLGRFVWRVSIPANTSALLAIPAAADATVLVDSRLLVDDGNLRVVDRSEGRLLVEARSGRYGIEVAPLITTSSPFLT